MLSLSSADLPTTASPSSVDKRFGLARRYETSEPCPLRRQPRPFALALLLVSLGVTGCAKKETTTPPPTPIRAEPTIAPGSRPSGPVWESQTQDTLPAPQPIPADAAALDPPPLRIDRSEPPASDSGAAPTEHDPATAAGNQPPRPPADAGPAPFRLGQILSAEERRLYNEMIDRDLRAAEQSLAAALSRGNLQGRATQVRRVRAFMTQVGEVRTDDLPLARNLAGRARLLAEDLAGQRP